MRTKSDVFSDELGRRLQELEREPKTHLIAIVGGGPGALAIIKLFESTTLRQFRTKVIGVADVADDAAGLQYAKERGYFTTNDFRQLFELPGLDLVVELTGSNEVRDAVVASKPPHVQLMDHFSARLFWDVIQIEEEKLRIERRLSNTERLASVGEMAAYIAHEIRNPLVAIGGFANSLLKTVCSEENCRRKARIIVEEVRRLEVVLRSVMNFARPLEPHKQRANINRVLTEACTLYQGIIRSRKIKLRKKFAKDLPDTLFDPVLIKQALINLMKNAIESMPSGGELLIHTDLCWDHIVIIISDSGSGMPPEVLMNIFNPFFTTKHDGMGIGLAMTKKIIEDHGGEITIESIPDVGTTFNVCLPIEFES
ncbi:MAG: ATP-binding protein [Pseudomonadota bacterium]